MKENTKVTMMAVLCALLFGMSFLGTKVTLDVMTPWQLMASRWTMALLAFLILLATGVVKVEYREKPLGYAAVLAFLQPCLYSFFETWGINLSTIGESAIILAVMPVFVTAVSILIFRIHARPINFISVVLAFVGVVITVVFSSRSGEEGQLLGYLFLALAVVAGGSYSFLSGKLSKDFSPMELTFIMVLTGSIWFNALAFINSHGWETYTLLFSSGRVFLGVAYLGILSSIGAFAMLNYVLAYMPTYRASAITMNVITLAGVASGVLFRGEDLRWNSLLGMALILIGIIGANRDEGKIDILTEKQKYSRFKG